ncbi:hypothetical protein NMYAN_10216 [Nitrosomonas nitrosa]|uniref:Uncharacterized protein n=1 Tax=Nitrosomonas nitrosa TaxID=52442 RepID=A0A8H9D9Y0_9PROT|nr:hypothetical protein NMYAN_10216 [Nitrosomonas nitrosa]
MTSLIIVHTIFNMKIIFDQGQHKFS